MKGEVFLQLRGIGLAKARRLADAGFFTLADIDHASLAVLAEVSGIGKQGALDLKEQVQDIIGHQPPSLVFQEIDDALVQESPQMDVMSPPVSKGAGAVWPDGTDTNQSAQASGTVSAWSAPTLATFVAALLIMGGVVGGLITYWSITDDLDDLNQRNDFLQKQIDGVQTSNDSITYFFGNISLASLYQQVRPSIVVIHGYTIQQTIFGTQYGETQGSGFIYNQSGYHIIVTNYHVVRNAVNITATLFDGRAYAASIVGSDPYADLAVLELHTELSELISNLAPLPMTSSATLEVGDPVVAIGTPFGLAGTMTTGIVSQLGRTISLVPYLD